MSKHLQRDIDLIRRELLNQFGPVKKVVDDSVRSLTEHRGDLLETVLVGDQTIDEREVLIEEQCLNTGVAPARAADRYCHRHQDQLGSRADWGSACSISERPEIFITHRISRFRAKCH